MLGIERRQKIIERLQQNRKVHVGMLSDEFDVTQETIRRDLEKLENDGMLLRSYGGAVLAHPSNEDMSFANRTTSNYAQKQVIAQKTIGLINNGSTIMADSSTTVLALVDLFEGKNDLTIISNSVKLLNDYADANFSLISTGGDLRAHSFTLVGAVACRTLRQYNVDIAILSCRGLDRERGVMESNEPECVVKQHMIQQAKSRILLVDHTKFDQVFFVRMMDFQDIDYVITDEEPSRPWIEFFKKQNIQLIY